MDVNYLIVVSILEGKNFPVRHDKYVVVEAKFDGEVMSTDPVDHVMLPNFNTELAWEVGKKVLQMHRLQRTPVKLLWYAVDVDFTKKESIGYIILDIRLAQEKRQNPKWLPLLNPKYQREKPEVLLSLFLEKETINPAVVSEKQIPANVPKWNEEKNGKKKYFTSAVPKAVQSTPHKESLPSSSSSVATPKKNILNPVLLLNGCSYRIGPPDQCYDKFTLSVILAFAANLNKLAVPAAVQSSKEEFYFVYSLFDNVVPSGKFANLSNPDFKAERAAVVISSSTDLLSVFFEQHPFLEILLYCGDVVIASGHVPLSDFASVNKHNIDNEPLIIEGSVQIIPIEKSSRPGKEDLSPFVGVTVMLQKNKEDEKSTPKSSPPETLPRKLIEENTTPKLPVEFHKKPIEAPKTLDILHEKKELNRDVRKQLSGFLNQATQNHIDNKMESQNQYVGNRTSHVKSDATPYFSPYSYDNSPSSVYRNVNGNIISGNSFTPSAFCFALNLCTFRATYTAHPIYVFFRYSYPFFGTSSSILSHPEIEVPPHADVTIPHGYCAFNFSTSFALLKSAFHESPLIIEVVSKKKQGNRQEEVIGTSRINLHQVLEASPLPHMKEKKPCTRRMSACKLSVISPEGHEIGEINAVMTLDDLSSTMPICDKHQWKTPNSNLPQLRNSVSTFDFPSFKRNGLSEDELLQAAFELELWQERQKELFRAQLKDKEMQHMRVLVSEWKQRDTERELLLQRKLQECQKLEDKLKQMMEDAEIKEKQLTAQEAELKLRLHNVEKQKEQQERETKKHVENMRDEYEELLRIEKLTSLDLEQANSILQRKVYDLEGEMQEQKRLIESLQDQINKDPDAQLKTEVNMLKIEKAELEQKLKEALSSKQKYKNQWVECVRLVSSLQQKVHVMEKLESSKKSEELADLQQRILAAEEKNLTQKEKEVLEKVKENIDNLKSVISPESNKEKDSIISLPSTSSNGVSMKAVFHPTRNGELNKCDIHVQQLIAQRDKLLKTGMYSEDDQIIKQLTFHIEKAKFVYS